MGPRYRLGVGAGWVATVVWVDYSLVDSYYGGSARPIDVLASVPTVTAVAAVVVLLALGRHRRASAGPVGAAVAALSLWATFCPLPDASPIAVLTVAETYALLILTVLVVRLAPIRQAVAVGALSAFAAALMLGRYGRLDLFPLGSEFTVDWLAKAVQAAAAACIGGYLRVQERRGQRAATAARRAQRLDLARDLHDFVAHDVTGMVVQTQAAQLVAQRDPGRTLAALHRIDQAGRQALASMARGVGALHDVDRAGDDGSTHGIDPAPPALADLPALAGRFAATGRTRVDLEVAPDLGDPPREVAITAYRVVVEALTNVRRHAPRAALVRVRVRRTEGRTGPVLTVAVGNDLAAPGGRAPVPRRRGGFGLLGLAGRVRALGGTLDARRRGGDWWIMATLPIAGRAAPPRAARVRAPARVRWYTRRRLLVALLGGTALVLANLVLHAAGSAQANPFLRHLLASQVWPATIAVELAALGLLILGPAGRAWAAPVSVVAAAVSLGGTAVRLPLVEMLYIGPWSVAYAETVALMALMVLTARWAPAWQAVTAGALLAAADVALGLRAVDPYTFTSVFDLMNFLWVFWSKGAVAAAALGVLLRGLDARRARAVVATRRAQRLQLTRDLRDLVAHDVTGMIVQARAAQLIADRDPPRALDHLRHIERAGLLALSSMDRIVRLLHDVDGDAPGTDERDIHAGRAPAPGIADLRDVVDRFRAGWTARVDLDVDPGVDGAIDRDVTTTGYLVVVHALTNIRRHAPDAIRVRVGVRRGGTTLTVDVRNDGAAPTSTTGLALLGLTARVEALGGTLVAGPRDGGWSVAATLPVGGAPPPSTVVLAATGAAP